MTADQIQTIKNEVISGHGALLRQMQAWNALNTAVFGCPSPDLGAAAGFARQIDRHAATLRLAAAAIYTAAHELRRATEQAALARAIPEDIQ